MTTRRCLTDSAHAGVWNCPCESGGDFCSHCLLSHLSTAELVHTPVPISPPLVCGRCHRQPLEAISVSYGSWLCSACASDLCTSQEVGTSAPLHASIPEPNLPVGEPLLGKSLWSSLRRFITEERADIQQSLRRMSSLEDRINETIEAQLIESQAEVMRMRSLVIAEGTHHSPELLEAAGRENRELKKTNEDLRKEVEVLREEQRTLPESLHREDVLMRKTVQQLQDTVETLKKAIDETGQREKVAVAVATEPLERSVREKNAEIALLREKITALTETHATEVSNARTKESVAMSMLHAMDLEGAGIPVSLATTALQGADGRIDAELLVEAMCAVAKIAKFAGVCPAAFPQKIMAKLRDWKEAGLPRIRSMRAVYEAVKGEEAGKLAVGALMALLEHDPQAFDATASVVLHLGKVADGPSTCELAAAASEYFSASPEEETWRNALLDLPINYPFQYQTSAQQCISTCLRCLSNSRFDRCYLHLLPLLKCPVADPTSLFVLVSRLSEVMLCSSTTVDLCKGIAAYAKSPLGTTSDLAIVVKTTTHLLQGLEAAENEVEAALTMLKGVTGSGEVMRFAAALLQVSESVGNYRLIPAAAAWWQLKGAPFPNTPFLHSLFSRLHAADRKTEAAKSAIELLAFLVQNQRFPFASMAHRLRAKNISSEDVFELLLQLPTGLKEAVLRTLEQFTAETAAEWFALTKSLLPANIRLVSHIYDVHRILVENEVQTIADGSLGKDILKMAQMSTKPEECAAVLEAVLLAMKRDGVDYAQVPTLCSLWLQCKRLLPGQDCAALIVCFLDVLAENGQEVKGLVQAVEATLGMENGAHFTSLLLLAKIYMENRKLVPDNARQFLAGTLANLQRMKEMNPTDRTKLEKLTLKATNSLKQSREASLLFLEGAYELCAQSFSAHIQILNRLLDTQTELLVEMSWIENFSHYLHLLKILNQQNAGLIRQLCELAVYIESQGLQVPDFPIELPDEPTAALSEFIASVRRVVKRHSGLLRFGYRLLKDLAKLAADEGLRLIPRVAADLVDAGAQLEFVVSWSESVLIELERDKSHPRLRSLLQFWSPTVASKCAPLINKLQGRVAAAEMESSLYVQANKLALVQSESVRLFDFDNRVWGNSMPISQAINASGTGEWIFLDDSTLFYCGGKHQAG